MNLLTFNAATRVRVSLQTIGRMNTKALTIFLQGHPTPAERRYAKQRLDTLERAELDQLKNGGASVPASRSPRK